VERDVLTADVVNTNPSDAALALLRYRLTTKVKTVADTNR
jgi:hypothetical protein